jgi:hypothetical protein
MTGARLPRMTNVVVAALVVVPAGSIIILIAAVVITFFPNGRRPLRGDCDQEAGFAATWRADWDGRRRHHGRVGRIACRGVAWQCIGTAWPMGTIQQKLVRCSGGYCCNTIKVWYDSRPARSRPYSRPDRRVGPVSCSAVAPIGKASFLSASSEVWREQHDWSVTHCSTVVLLDNEVPMMVVWRRRLLPRPTIVWPVVVSQR